MARWFVPLVAAVPARGFAIAAIKLWRPVSQ
jgi:hypothetical protein